MINKKVITTVSILTIIIVSISLIQIEEKKQEKIVTETKQIDNKKTEIIQKKNNQFAKSSSTTNRTMTITINTPKI
jgi:hypothetical protein